MRGRLLAVLMLAAACGDGPPVSDVPLRIDVGAREVELGRAFPLTVTRVWQRDGKPVDWSEASLSPLVLRVVETKRRQSGGLVEETRRYRCYAFSLGGFSLPVPSGDPIDLRVKRTLDPADPGPAELPGDPLPEGLPWILWWTGGLVALSAILLLVRPRRRKPPAVAPPEPVEEAPRPHLRALERIGDLRGRQPESHEEFQSWYVEASALLREYAGERFFVRTAEMTTEELADVESVLHRKRLAEVLRACDLVKFARDRPPAQGRESLLLAAESFVRETA